MTAPVRTTLILIGALLAFGFAYAGLQPDDRIELKNSNEYSLIATITARAESRLASLVSAGIPLRVRYEIRMRKHQRAVFTRTLHHDIVRNEYTVIDSHTVPQQKVTSCRLDCSDPTDAIACFRRFGIDLKAHDGVCQVEGTVLRSRVSSLDRTIDMGEVWGCRRFFGRIALGREKRSHAVQLALGHRYTSKEGETHGRDR